MTDTIMMATATAGVVAVAILAIAALKGWQDWIALQRMGLERRGQPGAAPVSAGSRIELADLKERVRKLEAIAAGVDL